MVRKYSDLYLDARKALLPGEGQQRAGLLARELLCAASGKTQEEILVRRDQYAPSDVCEKMADFTARPQESRWPTSWRSGTFTG